MSEPLQAGTGQKEGGKTVAGQAGDGFTFPKWMYAGVFALVSVVVIYAIVSGLILQKVGIPGLFELDFASPAQPQAVPVASRDFVLGQWQLQINPAGGNVTMGTSITYYADGTLTGTGTQFVNNQGVQVPLSGTWTFEKLSDREFMLSATINGSFYQNRFVIFDANHIQNEDQNYVAVRVP